MTVQKIKICKLADIKENASIKFKIADKKFDREGILIKSNGELYAYFNECAHISLPLDWDDNDFFSADFKHLVCKNHGAHFEPSSGKCNLGPCVGAALNKIEFEIESTDDGEFVVGLI